jgi:hypothetical protein
MSDETELNHNLTDELLAIESALRSTPVPEPSIDHDSIMYQAGWAAAMARRDDLDRIKAPPATASKAQFWPAVAMTFAASTAACLMFIFWGQSTMNQAPAMASQGSAIPIELELEQVSNAENIVASSTKLSPTQSNHSDRTWVQSNPFQSNVATLFGLPQQPINHSRNAQLKRFLDEVAEPAQFVMSSISADDDAEVGSQLTTGSRLPDVF